MADPATILAGGAASMVGGFFGARRAGQGIKRAGTTLANAYNQAGEDVWKIPGMVNPGIQRAYGQAGEDVYNEAYGGSALLDERARAAQAGMDTAVTGANQYLNPYAEGGQTAFRTLSDLANTPAMSREELTYKPGQLEMDPGYQFRLEQGQKALERSAATKGMLQSGSFAKSLAGYSQGLASQEYAAAYERGRREFGDSFDRMMRSRQERTGLLSGLVNVGSQAAGQIGKNTMYGAEYGGNMGYKSAETGGDWRNRAALYKGNAGINSELAQAGNVVNAANAGIGYRLQGAGATAGSQEALGNVWGNFYSNAGRTAANTITQWGQANSGQRPGKPGKWDSEAP